MFQTTNQHSNKSEEKNSWLCLGTFSCSNQSIAIQYPNSQYIPVQHIDAFWSIFSSTTTKNTTGTNQKVESSVPRSPHPPSIHSSQGFNNHTSLFFFLSIPPNKKQSQQPCLPNFPEHVRVIAMFLTCVFYPFHLIFSTPPRNHGLLGNFHMGMGQNPGT